MKYMEHGKWHAWDKYPAGVLVSDEDTKTLTQHPTWRDAAAHILKFKDDQAAAECLMAGYHVKELRLMLRNGDTVVGTLQGRIKL